MDRGNFLSPGWGVYTRYIDKSPMADMKQEPENGDVECKDMVLLGLKLDSTETHVREYFKDVEVLGQDCYSEFGSNKERKKNCPQGF